MDDNAISQQPYLTFFDDDTAEYDVIVDQSSSAPNLKEATWGALQPLLPLIAERIGPEEFQLILEYSPMPESFLEKLKAIQDQKAQQPPPPDPEMLKIEAMKQAKAAELQMKQQEAGVEMQLEAQKTQQQLALEREKAAAELELEREKMQFEMMLEQQRAALERDKLRMQLAMEQERNAVTMGMEREKMGFEQERQKGEFELKSKQMRSEMALKAGKVASEDGESDDDIFGNKAIANALTEMANATTQMAEGVATLGSELKEALTKPKSIIRGPDGRAIGVQ